MILTTIPSRVFWIFVGIAAVALPPYLTVESQRQDNRALHMQEVKELPAKSKRYALVIGVDEYQDEQISRLSGAGNDAKALADALVRYAGFPADQVGRSTSGAGPGGLPLRGYEFDVVTVNSSGSEMSRRKGQAQYYVEDIAGISLALVAMPGGTFLMGSTKSDDEKPAHQVTVGSFYIGKHEVTQAQWRAVASLPKVVRDLNSDPSKFKSDNLPVEQVSWEEAVEFCARLSRATGRTYRLPTEAEWEYACRAGTTTPFAFGETIATQLVNYNGNYPYAQAPKGMYRETTTPVGFMGVANAFGLYDMHGNVFEWCLDYWHGNYNGAPTDGRSWETAGDKRYRVLRGGSWRFHASHSRSANRLRHAQTFRFDMIGFRVVAGARTP